MPLFCSGQDVIFVCRAAEWMNETFDGRRVSQAGRAAGSAFYRES